MPNIKQKIKSIPLIGLLAKVLYFLLIEPFRKFSGSEDYWKQRYAQGGSSGDGSYKLLADFKAEVLNALVAKHEVESVIEFGCGDGNQLSLLNFSAYQGVDVSPQAIALCKDQFSQDATKAFSLLEEYRGQQSDMSMSLDVIYHLVEDEVFENHMKLLFESATALVVIYSSDTAQQQKIQGKHIRHRKFTDWIARHINNWELARHIPNKYPYKGDDTSGSFADFYIYSPRSQKKE
ncbi:MAG: hypothetical protein COA71_10610 [SAR86 cluster bacterium]|uniref:Methyltransferase type 11 domain-containing protein n=1 Tax=SAR86 cluster bacterium TaxID=2030880 RepID=A0A2A5C9W4_9GAMM|nr:MAG: hypothetical protein COA71_10610 [SAR86 cluster bacterium]